MLKIFKTKLNYLVVIGAFALTLLPQEMVRAQSSQKVKIFLMAGQSNTQGYGHKSGLQRLLCAEDEINLPDDADGCYDELATSGERLFEVVSDFYGSHPTYDSTKARTVAQLIDGYNLDQRLLFPYDPVQTIVFDYSSRSDNERRNVNNWSGPLSVGYGYKNDGSTYGPELTFGHYMSRLYEEDIVLIKVAEGGSDLYEKWRSPSMEARLGVSEVESNYPLLQQHLTEVIDDIGSFIPKYEGVDVDIEVAGFVWFQGFNDTTKDTYAAAYEENLTDFISDLKIDLNMPDVPVLIGQTQRGSDNGLVVSAAQETVANALPNATSVFTRDLSNYFHFDPASYLVIGHRFGEAMQALLDLEEIAVLPAAPSELIAEVLPLQVPPRLQVNLSWSENSNNEEAIYIERSINPDTDFGVIASLEPNTTNYTDWDLEFGTTYYYRVNAFSKAGYSEYSNTSLATTEEAINVIPAAPSGLIAKASPVLQINLNWSENSNNEEAIYIERSINPGTDFSVIASLEPNTTNYTDWDLEHGTTYYYRVNAFNIAGYSEYSSTVVATTDVLTGDLPQGWSHMDMGTPSLPGAASYESGVFDIKGQGYMTNTQDNFHFAFTQLTGDGEISGLMTRAQKAGWDNNGLMMRDSLSPDAKYVMTLVNRNSGIYQQIRKEDNSTRTFAQDTSVPVWLKLVRLGDVFTSFSSTDGINWLETAQDTVIMQETLYIGLAAYASHNNKTTSSTWSQVTIIQPEDEPVASLEQPSELTAEATSSESIQLNWVDHSENETGFKLEQDLDGTGNFEEIAEVAANITSIEISDLSPATTYTYRIKAYNETQESEYSNTATATTEELPSLPYGWSNMDIGNPRMVGSATYEDGIFNMAGQGYMRSANDDFHFAFTSLTGDGEISAQLAKARKAHWDHNGLMMRDSLSQDSKFVMTLVRHNYDIYQQVRKVEGEVNVKSFVEETNIPLWLKLVRKGNHFSSYSSLDGISWELTAQDTVEMKETIHVGLASYASHANKVTISSWSDVSVVDLIEEPVTDLEQPSDLTAETISSQSIRLNWTDHSENETGFKIEQAIDSAGTFEEIIQVAQNTTSIEISALSLGTSYTYRIRAYNDTQNSDYSNSATATTDTLISDLPQGWSHMDVGTPSLPGAASYESGVFDIKGQGYMTSNYDNFHFAFTQLTGDGEISGLMTKAQKAHWDNNGIMMRDSLSPNAKYVMTLVNRNSGIYQQIRKEDNSTRTFAQDTTVPVWLKLVRTGDIFTSYSSTDGIDWLETAEDTVMMKEIVYIGLAAYASHNNKATSSSWSHLKVTLSEANLAPPTSLSTQINIYNEVTLQWADNSDNELGFVIERSTEGEIYTRVATLSANTTRYTETALTEGSYYYRVKAFNELGDSFYSDEVEANAFLLPPSTLSTQINSTEVTLQWVDNSDNESGFVIERAFNSNEEESYIPVDTLSGNATSYTDTVLTLGTYFYRVKAFNEVSDSFYSDEVEVKVSEFKNKVLHLQRLAGDHDLSQLSNTITVSTTDEFSTEEYMFTNMKGKSIDVALEQEIASVGSTISLKIVPEDLFQESDIFQSEALSIRQIGDQVELTISDSVWINPSLLDTIICNHVAVRLSNDSVHFAVNGEWMSSLIQSPIEISELELGSYQGQLWDIRLYDRALTNHEIGQIGNRCGMGVDYENPYNELTNYMCGSYYCIWASEDEAAEMKEDFYLYSLYFSEYAFQKFAMEAQMYNHEKTLQERVENGVNTTTDNVDRWYRWSFTNPVKPGGKNVNYVWHEYFHSFQFDGGPKWLTENTANWGASYLVDNHPGAGIAGSTFEPQWPIFHHNQTYTVPGGNRDYQTYGFLSFITRFVSDPSFIGRVFNTESVINQTNHTLGIKNILEEDGHDLKEVLTEYAARTTVWDYEDGSGSVWENKEDETIEIWDERGFTDYYHKFANTHEANGTDGIMTTVPDTLRPYNYGWNAIKIDSTAAAEYVIKFAGTNENPEDTEFRNMVVKESGETFEYYNMSVSDEVAHGSGEVEFSITAQAEDKLYLIVVATPDAFTNSVNIEDLEQFNYQYSIEAVGDENAAARTHANLEGDHDLIAEDWVIYPIPTDGHLEIRLPSDDIVVSDIELVNLDGKQIPSQFSQEGIQITVDFEGIQGAYFLRVHTPDLVVTHRIWKQ